ncbi:MAG: hypothetical protein WEC99_08660, partial [Halofilum sp. (in: g-proteobacteria)]
GDAAIQRRARGLGPALPPRNDGIASLRSQRLFALVPQGVYPKLLGALKGHSHMHIHTLALSIAIP